jgi:hypothetical protein
MEVKGNFDKKLKEYFDKAGITYANSKNADLKAKTIMGLRAINWIVNGSSNESVIPPIKDGILRGSGSVHVGNKFVGGVEGYSHKEQNKQHTANSDTVTVGFNTAYAARMHEGLLPDGDMQPGPVSILSGDVGGKFVEKHLNADNQDLMALYAAIFKKETSG